MADTGKNVTVFAPPRLPWHPKIEESFGVSKAAWPALIDARFPGAQSVDSVILALSYCKARQLDPFKPFVHIVSVWNTNLNRYVDTIWPGIGELRTTAFRTGQYAGCDATEFGPNITETFSDKVRQGKEGYKQVDVKVTFPEWARVTVYRMIGSNRISFPGPTVYWRGTYGARGRSTVPNEMWAGKPHYMLEKCAEAAALRKAFPEEIGDQQTDDEVAGRTVDWPGQSIEGQATEQEDQPARPTRQSVAAKAIDQQASVEVDVAEAEREMDAEYVATVGPATKTADDGTVYDADTGEVVKDSDDGFEMSDERAQEMVEQILKEIGSPDSIKTLEYKTARPYVVNGIADLRQAGKAQKVAAILEHIQSEKDRLAKTKGRE